MAHIGIIKPLTTPVDGAPSYTGHQYDTSTGLIYAQQRYYDPALGRFLGIDPMAVDPASAANWNRYAYANNNPYRFTDPDGRESAMFYTRQYQMAQPDPQVGAAVLGTIVDFTPVVGDIKGFVDAYNDPSAANVVAAGIGLVPVFGDAAGKIIKNADNIGDAIKGLPKPPTGPGSVPKAERDPKRLFTPSERAAKRAEQGNQCRTGCGTQIDETNSAGHHIQRHADGGPTTSENHAEVCTDCHEKLHSKD